MVLTVLFLIAPPFTITNDTGKSLINTILRDLKATAKHGTSNGRLLSKDAVKTFGKTLSRYPTRPPSGLYGSVRRPQSIVVRAAVLKRLLVAVAIGRCSLRLLKTRPKKELRNGSLEDIISPPIVLIIRLCLDAWTAPRMNCALNLDRSAPLEGWLDILGRCLRLMGSVYHPELEDDIQGKPQPPARQ
ncbi:hypothetical protein IW262DRAFT_1536778 [Armillaria fumosa]|nr:hypothetical protein IW262DRAFT_1536778 [Armillaria fumosa]